MKIEILGTGCAKCNALMENVQTVIEKLGLEDCTIAKIQEFNEIAKRGVLMTPALVVNGKVKTIGKVPGIDEIIGFLRS